MGEDKILDRVRKLLAKAEDESCTPQEAEALTEKAAELMAKYGIDRALLAATKPETDKPSSKMVDIDNPWGKVKAHLLFGLGAAMRCQCIMLTTRDGLRSHVFGYASDIERLDLLYTSLLLQMTSAMNHTVVPAQARSVRSWRRSFLLGFASAVVGRVKVAEERAAHRADADRATTGGTSTALVLADRSLVIKSNVKREYPVTRTSRLTYSGTGYGAGYARGSEANIGGTSVRNRSAGALH